MNYSRILALSIGDSIEIYSFGWTLNDVVDVIIVIYWYALQT